MKKSVLVLLAAATLAACQSSKSNAPTSNPDTISMEQKMNDSPQNRDVEVGGGRR